ncbi:Exoglucanase B precursor [compost metagenome]
MTTPITSIVEIRQTPYMIDDQGTLKSETELTLEHQGESFEAWIEIGIAGKSVYLEPIGIVEEGTRIATVHVEELDRDDDLVSFRLFDNPVGAGEACTVIATPQKKIRHWKVYVSHDFHVDIGYTDSQEHLRNIKWPSHIDAALDYADETDACNSDDQFRFHFESSYLLFGSVLHNRDADWIRKLKERLASGRMAYASGYMNTSMEAMSTEQLVRYYYYSERYLKDMLGIAPSGVALMVDNPSMSWANIDIMADIGVRYLYFGFNLNPRTPRVMTDVYPRLFYMKGRKPDNKALVFNGLLYNRDQMQFVPDGAEGIEAPIEETIRAVSDTLMNTFQSSTYVSDAVLELVAQYWDNGALYPQVNDRIRDMNARTDAQGRPYVYPRFINSNVKEFYEYVESNFSKFIPSYQGTIENWWNFGIPSDAYSEGEVRNAHDRLPAAEMLATLASASSQGVKYPYTRIADAYNYMMLYDEHTFGPMDSSAGEQHIWKRNNALAARKLTDSVVSRSVQALGTLVPTQGRTLIVMNPLSWTRTDLVQVQYANGFPAHFDLIDAETSKPVKYQKLDDGSLSFVASNVPGPGYKTYRVMERMDDPTFDSSITHTADTLENRFFKITFGCCGEIVSILDKTNHDIELVDSESPYKMNEYVYFTSAMHSFDVQSESRIERADVKFSVGSVQGRMISEGMANGTAGVQRNVILYDDLPRIDFVNVVQKTEAPGDKDQEEEAFFTFPLHVPDFTLRSEMPTGDFRPYVDANIENPELEQYYATSTDFYTVNRWIDASDEKRGHGITLYPVTAPVVQYGERRTLLYDVDYNMSKPWVLSYIYGNKWNTNFMKSQPGPTTFRYALRSHAGSDWRDGRADLCGRETFVPLEATMVDCAQDGAAGFDGAKCQWIDIDQDNVVITTVKPAEANGEGMILRFNETLGQDTTVTVNLGFFHPSTVCETDLMENDRTELTHENGKVTFRMDGYGWKTIRIRYGEAPGQVAGVTAVADASGTLITWSDINDPKLMFYEVFRDSSSEFIPGTGTYVGTVTGNHYYDLQVTAGMAAPYYYRVRAVRGGLKGDPSSAAEAIAGRIDDCEAPSAPEGLRVDFTVGNRVSLTWEPSSDNVTVQGYKVFRDGEEIADLPSILNSYLDLAATPGMVHQYHVAAYDQAGNVSKM